MSLGVFFESMVWCDFELVTSARFVDRDVDSQSLLQPLPPHLLLTIISSQPLAQNCQPN